MQRLTSLFITSALMLGTAVVSPLGAVYAANVGSMGSFAKVEKPTSGTAKIVKDGNKTYVELGANFQTSTDGPDLKVILFNDSKIPLHLKGKKYTTLAPLKEFKGKQRYEIPATVNLKDVKSVGIWCEQFDATFGFAPLK